MCWLLPLPLRFQSTLPRRERRSRCAEHSVHGDFNPRSREGSDVLIESGARICANFNPRSREGSDDALMFAAGLVSYFNPRSREGSDPVLIFAVKLAGNFNPRSREGSDQPGAHGFVNTLSFQSTLPRRERPHLLTSFRLQYGYFYFISTIKYSSCFKKIN